MVFALRINLSSPDASPLAASGLALAGRGSTSRLRALRARIAAMLVGQTPAALMNAIDILTTPTLLVKGSTLAVREARPDRRILVVRRPALPGRVRDSSVWLRWRPGSRGRHISNGQRRRPRGGDRGKTSHVVRNRSYFVRDEGSWLHQLIGPPRRLGCAKLDEHLLPRAKWVVRVARSFFECQLFLFR